MNDINSQDLNFDNPIINYKISGSILLDNHEGDIVFKDCEILDDIKLEDDSSNVRFSFTGCNISGNINVYGKLEHIIFFNCNLKKLTLHKECIINNLHFLSFAQTSPLSIESIILQGGHINYFKVNSYSIKILRLTNQEIGNILIHNNNNELIETINIEDSKVQEGEIDVNNIKKIIINYLEENSTLKFFSDHVEDLEISNGLYKSNLFFHNSSIEKMHIENILPESSIMHFENIIVHRILSLINSNLKNTSLLNCQFDKCELIIRNTILSNINTINTLWPNRISISDLNNKLDKSFKFQQEQEFYRQLKVNSINQYNQFNTLLFYTKEMNVYLESLRNLPNYIKKLKNWELTKKFKWLKWIINNAIWFINPIYDFIDLIIVSIILLKNPFEKFRIWCFKYTNNFGSDWIRPSLIYLLGSYLLFYFANDNYEFSRTMQFDIFLNPNFPDFLNPINKLSLTELGTIKSYRKSILSLITVIFQGFMIYQIIRGFRKFTFKS